MESKIIPFPKSANLVDPVAERALFFAEYELNELVATIPQASPEPAKFVY